MIATIRKKAQEVSFVLLRVAGYIRHKELASRLESISYQLIESLYSDDLNTANAKVEAAIGLSSLASNIGEMSSGNTAIILRELENLKTGIQQYRDSQQVKEMPSVEGLFSKLTISAPAKTQRPVVSHRGPVIVKQLPQKSQMSALLTADSNGASINRQGDILARIRQSSGSKLQLKDIIAAFPSISERTLRYDLVKLCQIGKLRREGSGGPSNFYVYSDGSTLPVSPDVSPDAASSHDDMGVMNGKPVSL